MIIILDRNAAIEVVLKRKKGAIFRRIIDATEKAITSEFFRVETANVI